MPSMANYRLKERRPQMEQSNFFKFMRQYGIRMPPDVYNVKIRDVSIHLGGDVTVEFEVCGGEFDGKNFTIRFRTVEGDDDRMIVANEDFWKSLEGE